MRLTEAKKGFVAAAQTLGGGAQLWLAGEVSPVSERLRAVAAGVGWVALSGVCSADVARGEPDIGCCWIFMTNDNKVREIYYFGF